MRLCLVNFEDFSKYCLLPFKFIAFCKLLYLSPIDFPTSGISWKSVATKGSYASALYRCSIHRCSDPGNRPRSSSVVALSAVYVNLLSKCAGTFGGSRPGQLPLHGWHVGSTQQVSHSCKLILLPRIVWKYNARASSSCALPVPFVHDLCTLINKLALTFTFLLLESSAASFEELVVNFGDVALACSMIERSFSFLPCCTAKPIDWLLLINQVSQLWLSRLSGSTWALWRSAAI